MKEYRNFKIGDEVKVNFMPGYIFYIDSFNKIIDPINNEEYVNVGVSNNIKGFEVNISDIKHTLSHIRNSKIDQLMK